MHNNISLKGEYIRKFIHLASGIVPILILVFGKDFILPKLILITMIFILLDFLKIRFSWILNIYNFFFKSLSRDYDLTHFTGASYVLIGYSIVLFVFPEDIAIFSIFILCISDTFAALIGRVYGNNKIGFKSLEGTFAFIFTGLLVSIFFQNIPLIIRILTVIITAFIELTITKVNDNLSIPIVASLVSYLGINIS
tara:strand:+ start:3692 stop:4279 length:588 start_codon:yes stop_codon:yes gene_type:complete